MSQSYDCSSWTLLTRIKTFSCNCKAIEGKHPYWRSEIACKFRYRLDWILYLCDQKAKAPKWQNLGKKYRTHQCRWKILWNSSRCSMHRDFFMFTAKKLLWVLKEQGQSWDGIYFREIILHRNGIPFLHDEASCMKVNATHRLLEDEGVKFWGNYQR